MYISPVAQCLFPFERQYQAVNVFNDGTGDKIWLTGGLVRAKCNGGTYDGSICLSHADCGGGTCSQFCVGGLNKGQFCTNDAQCDGSVCRAYSLNNYLNDVWFTDDGITWYSGFCTGGLNDGDPCNQNANCDSNVCTVNIANNEIMVNF